MNDLWDVSSSEFGVEMFQKHPLTLIWLKHLRACWHPQRELQVTPDLPLVETGETTADGVDHLFPQSNADLQKLHRTVGKQQRWSSLRSWIWWTLQTGILWYWKRCL